MAISVLQISPRGTSSGPALSVAATFSSTPSVGSWVIALLNTGSGKFGSDPTGWTLTDNQGNTYTQRAVATGDGNRLSVWTAPITTASGTFTATGTVAPGGVDSAQGMTLLEVSALNSGSLVDLLVQLSDQVSYLTTFNVTTAATDTADEIVIALAVPRGNGSFNASPSPSVPPTNYTTIFKTDSGNGAGYAAYRITTATGAQSINLSGLPIDGSPGLVIVSFRGAVSAPSGPVIDREPRPQRRKFRRRTQDSFTTARGMFAADVQPGAIFDPSLTFPAGGGGDVTAALTGVQAAGAVGTVAVVHTNPLTGAQGTGAAGNVTPSLSIGLTGNQATGSTGSVSSTSTVPLTGAQGSGQTGALTPNTVIPLTGVQGTGQVGTVTPSTATEVALTGVQATGGVGTLGVVHTNPAGGTQGTGAAGTVSPTNTVGVTGNQVAGSHGNVTPSTSGGLTGVQTAGSPGTVGVTHDNPLSGGQGTGQVGNVSLSGDVVVALTGVQATGQVGSVGVQAPANEDNYIFWGGLRAEYERVRLEQARQDERERLKELEREETRAKEAMAVAVAARTKRQEKKRLDAARAEQERVQALIDQLTLELIIVMNAEMAEKDDEEAVFLMLSAM